MTQLITLMIEACDFTTEIVLLIITAIIAALAQYWFIRRSELRNRMCELIKEVDALEDMAIQYWSKDLLNDANLILETKIKSRLYNIQKTSAQLQKSYYLYKPSIKEEYIRAKITITGGEFESRPKPVIIGRIDLIEQCLSSLKNSIRDSQKAFF